MKQQDNLSEILQGAETLPLPATKSLSAQLKESKGTVSALFITKSLTMYQPLTECNHQICPQLAVNTLELAMSGKAQLQTLIQQRTE